MPGTRDRMPQGQELDSATKGTGRAPGPPTRAGGTHSLIDMAVEDFWGTATTWKGTWDIQLPKAWKVVSGKLLSKG